MMKTSLAVAALLGVTEAVELGKIQQNILGDNDLLDYKQGQAVDAEELELGAQGSAMCMKSINRWTSESNSLHTFQQASSAGKKWKDADFPAEESSLFWSDALTQSAANEASTIRSTVVGWKRPGQMGYGWPKTPSLWGSLGKPVPGGIHQQGLGDCWFLASAAAVAEESDRILKLTANHKYPTNGIFRWKFWVKNAWVSVNVDDRLPVRSWGSGFRPWATSRSSHGAWWMPMMEKSYAKLNQNYQRLSGGFGTVALRTLTGAPVARVDHTKGAASLWSTVKPFAGRNFPMVSGCCNANSGNLHGLVSGHEYSLLDLHELSNGVKLAQVRNPWGSENYKGPWSDKSSLWTAAFKAEVGWTDADDGKFFLPYESYYNQFSDTTMAFTGEWKHQQMSAKQTGRKMYHFTNPTDQVVYASVDMFGPINYPRTCARGNTSNKYHQYAVLYDESYSMIGTYDWTSYSGFAFLGDLEGPLKAGKYMIQFVNQNAGQVDATINIYSQHGVSD